MSFFTNKEVYDIYLEQNATSSKEAKVYSTVSILEEMCVEKKVDWELSTKLLN